ncbi:MAG: hypothetical protein ACYC5O_21545 [Anaerolineae bacterium]
MTTATTERIGWRGTCAPGLMRYHYERFEGCETQTMRGNRGDIVSVDYQTEVDAGTMTLELTDQSQQPVWQCCVFGDGAESASIPLPADGSYQVKVHGDGTRGAFDVRWSVEQAAHA